MRFFRIRGLVNSRTSIVFIFVALCFFMLFRYRANVNALQPGQDAPDIRIETLAGKKFSLYDFQIPVMITFVNTKTFLTSSIYPDLMLRRIPALKQIQDKYDVPLLVFMDTDQTAEAVKEKLRSKKYKSLENTVYLSNIKQAMDGFGLSSMPHFFLINGNHTVIYDAKVPSLSTLDAILKGR